MDQKRFQKNLKLGRPIYYVCNLYQTVCFVNLHFDYISTPVIYKNTDK